MAKVFETVQCASRWSNGSLAGSDVMDSPRTIPAVLKPRPKFSSDSFIDEISDTDSDDLYP